MGIVFLWKKLKFELLDGCWNIRLVIILMSEQLNYSQFLANGRVEHLRWLVEHNSALIMSRLDSTGVFNTACAHNNYGSFEFWFKVVQMVVNEEVFPAIVAAVIGGDMMYERTTSEFRSKVMQFVLSHGELLPGILTESGFDNAVKNGNVEYIRAFSKDKPVGALNAMQLACNYEQIESFDCLKQIAIENFGQNDTEKHIATLDVPAKFMKVDKYNIISPQMLHARAVDAAVDIISRKLNKNQSEFHVTHTIDARKETCEEIANVFRKKDFTVVVCERLFHYEIIIKWG